MNLWKKTFNSKLISFQQNICWEVLECRIFLNWNQIHGSVWNNKFANAKYHVFCSIRWLCKGQTWAYMPLKQTSITCGFPLLVLLQLMNLQETRRGTAFIYALKLIHFPDCDQLLRSSSRVKWNIFSHPRACAHTHTRTTILWNWSQSYFDLHKIYFVHQKSINNR